MTDYSDCAVLDAPEGTEPVTLILDPMVGEHEDDIDASEVLGFEREACPSGEEFILDGYFSMFGCIDLDIALPTDELAPIGSSDKATYEDRVCASLERFDEEHGTTFCSRLIEVVETD